MWFFWNRGCIPKAQFFLDLNRILDQNSHTCSAACSLALPLVLSFSSRPCTSQSWLGFTESCPVKRSHTLAKDPWWIPTQTFGTSHLHRFFSSIWSHKFQLFQQPGTVIFALSAHSALALFSYVIVGMYLWQKTVAIVGLVLCFLSLKNYSPMLPIVLCLKTIASYILFMVRVYCNRKTSQVSVILSLWDTEVSEHILLKPFWNIVKNKCLYMMADNEKTKLL